jgi:hypothetical protein
LTLSYGRRFPAYGNLLDPLHRLHQVGQRVGVAEPDIAVAMFAETAAAGKADCASAGGVTVVNFGGHV